MLDLTQFLNLTGLTLITVGSICAARSAPAPAYGSDGSVSLVGPEMQGSDGVKKRKEMHERQKRFPKFLGMIAAGAVVQALAVFVPCVPCA